MSSIRRRAALVLTAVVFAAVVPGQESTVDTPAAPALVTSPMPFIGITPCRIADTRDATRPPGYGPPSLSPGMPRPFTIAGTCGIPAGAQAVSLNVTVVGPLGVGYVLLYPQGGPQPGVSTINYVQGQTVANAAVVPLGTGGGITVAAAVSGTDFLIDTNGYYAGSAVQTTNTFLGAGNATMTGLDNTAAGSQALAANTSGSNNTAAGRQCLMNNTTGSNNTAVGFGALLVTTTGSDNTATDDALGQNTTGTGNTAIGEGTLFENTTGSYNTVVGGSVCCDPTGNSNTAIGPVAGFALTSGSNNLYLGDTASVSSDSGSIRIADSSDDSYTMMTMAGVRNAPVLADAVPVFIDPSKQLATTFSSIRYKEDVRDVADGSHGILSLRPITFRYKSQAGDRRQFGLLAEDVAATVPDLVVRDGEGRPETVLYQELPVLLLNEIQKQAARIEAGEREIAEESESLRSEQDAARSAEALLDDLEHRLAALESPGTLPVPDRP